MSFSHRAVVDVHLITDDNQTPTPEEVNAVIAGLKSYTQLAGGHRLTVTDIGTQTVRTLER